MAKKKSIGIVNPNYIDLRRYNVEVGTKENLKVGVEYIISREPLSFKTQYFKDIIRRRLTKWSEFEGIKIFNEETEEEYKKYVDTIRIYIESKIIYKIELK